jgi:hypothetical protein
MDLNWTEASNDEETSLSDDTPRAEHPNTGDDHGQDESCDRTDEIHNFAESNITSQTVGSHEQGDQSLEDNMQEHVQV